MEVKLDAGFPEYTFIRDSRQMLFLEDHCCVGRDIAHKVDCAIGPCSKHSLCFTRVYCTARCSAGISGTAGKTETGQQPLAQRLFGDLE